MVHSGYEPTSVDHAFGSLRGFAAMVRASLFGHRSKIDRPVEARPASRDEAVIELPVLQSDGKGNDHDSMSRPAAQV